MIQLTEEQFIINELNSSLNDDNDKILLLPVLYCKICQQLPSSPIMTYKYGNLCNLCYNPENHPDAVRNKSLEEVFNQLKISCPYKNNGCNLILTYEDLMDHKTECDYRNFNCPVNDCIFEGSIITINEHLKSCHSDLILTENIKNGFISVLINIIKSNKSIFIFSYDEKEFLFQIICNAELNQMLCIVYYMGIDYYEYSDFFYTIELVTKFGWSLKSDGKYLPFSDYENINKNDTIIDYNLTTRMQIVRNNLLLIKNVMIDVPDTILINLHLTNEEDIENKTEILKSLECSICKNYMIEPIEQCSKGHSICEACHTSLNKCSVCNSSFKNTRNFALEFISNTVYRPCNYHNFGCNMNLLGTEMKVHENECIYKPYTCPFKNDSNCDWKNTLSTLSEHLEQSKCGKIVYTNYVQVTIKFSQATITLNSNRTTTQYYQRYMFCMKMMDEIFCVHYKHNDNGDTWWAVQIVRSGEQSRQYKYELTLVDLKNENHVMIVKDLCNNFVDIVQYVLFNANLCMKFISKTEAKYYIKIVPVD